MMQKPEFICSTLLTCMHWANPGTASYSPWNSDKQSERDKVFGYWNVLSNARLQWLPENPSTPRPQRSAETTILNDETLLCLNLALSRSRNTSGRGSSQQTRPGNNANQIWQKTPAKRSIGFRFKPRWITLNARCMQPSHPQTHACNPSLVCSPNKLTNSTKRPRNGVGKNSSRKMQWYQSKSSPL